MRTRIMRTSMNTSIAPTGITSTRTRDQRSGIRDQKKHTATNIRMSISMGMRMRRIDRCPRFSRSLRPRRSNDSVKQRASRAFQLLGEAEAAIHSIPIEKVHFHEVGAVDTIVDIVCAAAGCEALGVDRWMASPLNVGSGTVKCAHGTLPVPAPATLALLGDAPVYAAGPPMERVTPTGAAMLRMLDVEYASAAGDARGCARAMARAGAIRRASRTCCACWWAKQTDGARRRRADRRD